MKTCRKCGVDKDDSEFEVHRKPWSRRECKTCCRDDRRKRDALRHDELRERDRERQYRYRRNPDKLGRIILIDARRSDKKRGFVTALTLGEVNLLISKPCFYCGETELRMTLDRVDNMVGHTRENVHQACIRCNYLRRDLPYAAWLEISPAIRRARKKGLFGIWTGRAR